MKIIIKALLLTAIGVFVVDYFSHVLFSNPMETTPYFLAKATLYVVFSLAFLRFIDVRKRECTKVFFASIAVSLLWGTYYNILPALFDFYPFGIPLEGLAFLGMGLVGTGIAFGTVHAVAFIVGYYASVFLVQKFTKLRRQGSNL